MLYLKTVRVFLPCIIAGLLLLHISIHNVDAQQDNLSAEKQDRTPTIGSDAKPLAEIPLIFAGDHVIIKIKVNDDDRYLNFILDTGASTSIIDSTIAKTLGCEPDQEVNVTGASGSRICDISNSQVLMVNEHVKTNQAIFIHADLTSWTERKGHPIAGFTGYDLFHNYLIHVDHVHKKIRFYHHDARIDTTGFKPVAFEFDEGGRKPVIAAEFELPSGDKFAGEVLFDTGAGLSLLIGNRFNSENGILDLAGRSYGRDGGGFLASEIFHMIKVNSASFSGFQFGEMEIRVSTNKQGVDSLQAQRMGVLGNAILKRFDLIVDYQNKTLYMKPNRLFNEPFPFNVSGIRLLTRDGNIFIDTVAEGCSAAASGLKSGDKIISIDGKTSNDLDTVRSWLAAEGATVEILVEQNQDKQRKVKLQLERLLN